MPRTVCKWIIMCAASLLMNESEQCVAPCLQIFVQHDEFVAFRFFTTICFFAAFRYMAWSVCKIFLDEWATFVAEMIVRKKCFIWLFDWLMLINCTWVEFDFKMMTRLVSMRFLQERKFQCEKFHFFFESLSNCFRIDLGFCSLKN